MKPKHRIKHNPDDLLILILILSVVTAIGLFVIQGRKHDLLLKQVKEAPQNAVRQTLEGKEGSYYLSELDAFISHYNQGRWEINIKKEDY